MAGALSVVASLGAPRQAAADGFADPYDRSPEAGAQSVPTGSAPTGSVPTGSARAPAEAAPAPSLLGRSLADQGAGDPLLARVDGEDIRWSDVVASARDLPETYRRQAATVLPALLRRLIDLKLLAVAGRAAGYGDDPAVRRAVRDFAERLVRKVFIEREVMAGVTDQMLRAPYQAYVARVEARARVHSRHILLETEDEARSVIDALWRGADFAALALARSVAPTATQGGDLGFLAREDMAPAFAEEAFRLPVGAYSQTPVHTKFGWHVIKVEARRAPQVKPFGDMVGTLRRAMARERVNRLLPELRAAAAIELFPAKLLPAPAPK